MRSRYGGVRSWLGWTQQRQCLYTTHSVARRRLNNESETWRCREEADERRRGRMTSPGPEKESWLGRANAAIRRHLNKRKKCDVRFNSQRAAAKQRSCERPRRDERRKKRQQQIKVMMWKCDGCTSCQSASSFLSSSLKSRLFSAFPPSTCCFPQTLAPQQLLMRRSRNFLKEKQGGWYQLKI